MREGRFSTEHRESEQLLSADCCMRTLINSSETRTDIRLTGFVLALAQAPLPSNCCWLVVQQAAQQVYNTSKTCKNVKQVPLVLGQHKPSLPPGERKRFNAAAVCIWSESGFGTLYPDPKPDRDDNTNIWFWGHSPPLHKMLPKCGRNLLKIHCKLSLYALFPNGEKSWIVIQNPQKTSDYHQNLISYLGTNQTSTPVHQNLTIWDIQPTNRQTDRQTNKRRSLSNYLRIFRRRQ